METRREGRRRTVRALAVAVALAALAPSCADKTTSNVAILDTAAAGAAERIVVKNRDFARRVQILDVRGRREGDFLEAFLSVQNQSDETVPFEYKVEWYDADGMPLDSTVAGWRPEQLDGRETTWLREMAPMQQARSFKFFIRDPNPVER